MSKEEILEILNTNKLNLLNLPDGENIVKTYLQMLGIRDIHLINVRDYIIPEIARTITDDYTFTEQGILNHEGLGWKVSIDNEYSINLKYDANKDYVININVSTYYDIFGNIQILKWIHDLSKITKQEKEKLSFFAQSIITSPNVMRDMDLEKIYITITIIDANEVEWRANEEFVSRKYPEYGCNIKTNYWCDTQSPFINYTRRLNLTDKLKDNLNDYQNEMIRYSIHGVEPTIQNEKSQQYYYYGEKNLYECLTKENEPTNDYNFDKLANTIRTYYQNELEPNSQVHPIFYLKNKWKNDENNVSTFLNENGENLFKGFNSNRNL